MASNSSSQIRSLRSKLRPARLAALGSAAALRQAAQDTRELAYRATRRLSGSSPWSITRHSVALAWFNKQPNFGDEISPLVIRATTGMTPRWVSPDYEGKIISTGSVLSYARENDLIVGAGLIRPERRSLPKGARVLAVRGPLTAELLGLPLDDLVLGDPGILAARSLGISRAADRAGICLIPHYVDLDATREILHRATPTGAIKLVDVRHGPRSVIEVVARSEVCISSSLHGLIVAESLGVPAIWTRVSEDITGGSFKFDDYYLGTRRTPPKPLALLDAVELAVSGEALAFLSDATGLIGAFAHLASMLRGTELRS